MAETEKKERKEIKLTEAVRAELEALRRVYAPQGKAFKGEETK